MKTKLYVIYDNVAESCDEIFMASNDGVAVRYSYPIISRNPKFQDLSLKCVGSIELSSGTLFLHRDGITDVPWDSYKFPQTKSVETNETDPTRIEREFIEKTSDIKD